MTAYTTEGTGSGSAADIKKLIYNGSVLRNNVAPHCLENYKGNIVLTDGKIVFSNENNSYVEDLRTKGPITEGLVIIEDSGASKTLSLSSGTIIKCNLTDDCTFSMPEPVAGRGFVLFLTQTGAYEATFSNVKWMNNDEPVITSISGRVDIFTFICDGIDWYGTTAQNFWS